MANAFFEEDSRVLTREAFDFVFNNELKRAVRSQSFLTLLLVTPILRDAPGARGDRDHLVREMARLISRDVRETDLLARTGKGRVSVVLLDADLPNSSHVIDRLMSRLEHYQFSQAIAIDVGAACCPTHGADADSLRRAAEARSPRRDRHGNASNR